MTEPDGVGSVQFEPEHDAGGATVVTTDAVAGKVCVPFVNWVAYALTFQPFPFVLPEFEIVKGRGGGLVGRSADRSSGWPSR